MKKLCTGWLALGMVAMMVVVAEAQPPDGQRRPRGGPGGRDRDFRPPPHPILKALDANGDQVISADEIENAVAALKSLDKNKDGQLSAEELRPDRGRRRPGGRDGDRGRRDFDRRDGDRRGGRDGDGPPRRGRRGGEGRGGEGRGGEGREGRERGGDGEGRRRPNPEEMVNRVMKFDEDGDGKVSRDELPERMHRMLDRGDKNEDGALDRAELTQLARQGGRGRGSRGDGRGGRRGPPGGGNHEA